MNWVNALQSYECKEKYVLMMNSNPKSMSINCKFSESIVRGQQSISRKYVKLSTYETEWNMAATTVKTGEAGTSVSQAVAGVIPTREDLASSSLP